MTKRSQAPPPLPVVAGLFVVTLFSFGLAVVLFEQLYADRAYLGSAETRPVRTRVAELAREIGVADRRRVRLEPPAPAEQLALAV